MARVVVVVGAREPTQRILVRRLGDWADLLVIRLRQRGRIELEQQPAVAKRSIERFADRALEGREDYSHLLVIDAPYVDTGRLQDTLTALEGLNATIHRPRPNENGWPARGSVNKPGFDTQLATAVMQTISDWYPAVVTPPASPREAVDRACADFAESLHFPENIVLDTSMTGGDVHKVLAALNELCQAERRGEAKKKRFLLQELLGRYLSRAKGTYKVGDTNVYTTNPDTGETIHCRERVHLVEGRPNTTESIYWATIGVTQTRYRYVIARIGRHP